MYQRHFGAKKLRRNIAWKLIPAKMTVDNGNILEEKKKIDMPTFTSVISHTSALYVVANQVQE